MLKSRLSLKALGMMVSMALFSHSAHAGWNGAGPINNLYLYKNYAVVVQGPVRDGPGCTNDGAWIVDWNHFSEQERNRVTASLLMAKATGANIDATIWTDACGHEGKKLFAGQLNIM